MKNYWLERWKIITCLSKNSIPARVAYLIPIPLMILFSACNKENIVTPLEGTYVGVVAFQQKRSPAHPCGINGCEEMIQPNRSEIDYEIRFRKDRYVAGINSGTFEWTADSILFNMEQFDCPDEMDCMVFLPNQQWVSYDLTDGVLSFSHTFAATSNVSFIQENHFILEKVEE